MTFEELGLFVVDKKYGNVCSWMAVKQANVDSVKDIYKNDYLIEDMQHVKYSYGAALQLVLRLQSHI